MPKSGRSTAQEKRAPPPPAPSPGRARTTLSGIRPPSLPKAARASRGRSRRSSRARHNRSPRVRKRMRPRPPQPTPCNHSAIFRAFPSRSSSRTACCRRKIPALASRRQCPWPELRGAATGRPQAPGRPRRSGRQIRRPFHGRRAPRGRRLPPRRRTLSPHSPFHQRTGHRRPAFRMAPKRPQNGPRPSHPPPRTLARSWTHPPGLPIPQASTGGPRVKTRLGRRRGRPAGLLEPARLRMTANPWTLFGPERPPQRRLAPRPLPPSPPCRPRCLLRTANQRTLRGLTAPPRS